jgi:hypothetical protein
MREHMNEDFSLLGPHTLEDYPCFTPMTSSTWLIRDRDPIPLTVQIDKDNLAEDHWDKFSPVLHQVETKRRQETFLEDLAKPEFTWFLDLYPNQDVKDEDEELVLPILFRTLHPGQALNLDIKLPPYKKAQLIIVEENKGRQPAAQGEGLPNVTLSAHVGEGGHLDVLYIHPLEEESDAEDKVCLYLADVEEYGTFRWTSINLGGSMLERGHVHLIGREAEADLGGASYIKEGVRQSVISHVFAHEPMGHIHIQNYGVVEEDGFGHFASIADIDKGSHQTKAREENRFMTLSPAAQAYADPTLLIDEYDVEASHQATVGQVNPEQLFYLQSRGLDMKSATRLMTAAFLTPLIDRVRMPELRDVLVHQFYKKMDVEDLLLGEEGQL